MRKNWLSFLMPMLSVCAQQTDDVQAPAKPSYLSYSVDASFLYWYAREDGLDLAINAVWSQPALQPFLATSTTTLFQTFDYHPGFRVGFGIAGYQQWEVRCDYTWLRGTNSLQKEAPASPFTTAGVDAIPNGSGTPVWMSQNWFLQGTSNNQALLGTLLASQWKYAIDFVDLMASSAFWQDSIFIVRPLIGLRFAAIRQSLRIALTEYPSFFQPSLPSQPIFSTNRSHNVGVGPKLGVDCKIKLFDRFRIEGMGALDCLWTHFSKITHSEDAASTSFNPGPYQANLQHWNCLRTMAELNLGIGWGRSLCAQKYSIDFCANYDFVYLWGQNMMRWQLDSILTGASESPADMMLHGLTLTGSFQF